MYMQDSASVAAATAGCHSHQILSLIGDLRIVKQRRVEVAKRRSG